MTLTTSQIERRLTKLEIAQASLLAGDPLDDWINAFRAGADVASRNASAGADWIAAAVERNRLADETLKTYGEDLD